jgi:hypothetical protein
VLSAALSWASSSQLVPEIETNGCTLAPAARGTRCSLRSGGTGYEPGPHRHGALVPAWALSPQAVEAIRAQMLRRAKGRARILAQRDEMIVSFQYGLCAQPGGVGAALVIAAGRVRLSARGPLKRAPV